MRVGTASAGPEISYQYRVSRDVLLEPRIGAEAIWTFARDMLAGRPIAVFNHGQMVRDFTYVDDIVDATTQMQIGRAHV